MSNFAEEEEHHLITLDELEATREQIISYQGLIKDLPEIYERKFNERIKPYLDRHQQLIDERDQLLGHLHHGLTPSAQAKTLVLPSVAPPLQGEGSRSTHLALGRICWLVALAILGLAVGMKLSRQFFPSPKKLTGSVPLFSPRQLIEHSVGLAFPQSTAQDLADVSSVKD